MQRRNVAGKGGEKSKQIFMAFGGEGLFLSKSSLELILEASIVLKNSLNLDGRLPRNRWSRWSTTLFGD